MESITQMESKTVLFYHFLPTKPEDEEEQQRKFENKKMITTNTNCLIKSELVRINPRTPKVLLQLYNPWEIKKVLTASDVGLLCRLLLKNQIVHEFIFPKWNPTLVYDIEYGEERKDVMVRDLDERSEHKLIFSKWKSSGSYILQGSWSSDFVKRRGLKRNDLIGLYWNPKFSFFAFAVLARSRQPSSSSSSIHPFIPR